MCYKKLFFTLVLSAGLFLTGCNKDKDKSGDKFDMPELNYPYSQLTPDQQKLKLEQDCLDFFDEAEGLKLLKAYDVISYLDELFGIDEPEVDEPFKEVSSTKEIFDLTNTYGVFTWNISQNRWNKSTSLSELKFVFPGSQNATTNNASLSVKVENSGSTLTYEWEDCNGWNCIDNEGVIYLPKSAIATLTLNNTKIAEISAAVGYKDDVPVSSSFKMTAEGYEYEYTIKGTGKETKLSTHLRNGKKNMIEGRFDMNMNIEEIMEDVIDDPDYVYDLNLKANGLTKMMDNLALVFQVDASELAKEIDDIESKDYSDKEYNDKMTQAYKKYLKVALVATKDGYKIADIIPRSEMKTSGYYTEYSTVFYLKFNDKTEIEASVYFDSGFDTLIDRIEDFLEGMFGKDEPEEAW